MHGRLLRWNLRYRRARHVLDAIAIAMTAAVVMVFVSVLLPLWKIATKNDHVELTRVLLAPRMPGGDLPDSLYPMLQRIDGVLMVMRYRTYPSRAESGATYGVAGEELDSLEHTQDFFPVEPDVIAAWKREPLGAVVTDTVVHDLGLFVGQTTSVATSFGPLPIKIVGISYGGVGHHVTVHYDYLTKFVGNPGTESYRLLTRPADAARVVRAIHDQTRDTDVPVKAFTVDQLTASEVRGASMIPILLGCLGLFLILTSGFTLATSTATTIRARRIELATFRVLGYRRRTLMAVILGEATVVGLTGGLIAAAATYLLFRNGVELSTGDSIHLFPPVVVGAPGIIAGLVVAVLVPVCGALPSAWLSLRAPLVTALRDSA